jgi:membrane protein implicated in regulation of membrane protease activity
LFTGALVAISELIFSSLMLWLTTAGITLSLTSMLFLGSINILLIIFAVLLAPLIYRGGAYWKAEKKISQVKIEKELLQEESVLQEARLEQRLKQEKLESSVEEERYRRLLKRKEFNKQVYEEKRQLTLKQLREEKEYIDELEKEPSFSPQFIENLRSLHNEKATKLMEDLSEIDYFKPPVENAEIENEIRLRVPSQNQSKDLD